VPAAGVPDAQCRPRGHADHAARGGVGFPFRPADHGGRNAYQPAAREDRPRLRSRADPHDPRGRLQPGRMNLLRSHSFRLALLYLGRFSVSVLIIFAVIYWATTDYMARTLDLSVATELAALENIYKSGGVPALVQAIRDQAPASGGRSTYELLLDP